MKSYTKPRERLDAAKILLQNRRQHQLIELQQQAADTFEYVKPVNLVTRFVSSLKKEPKVRGSLKDTFISVGLGYLSKRLVVGKSNSMLKTLAGYAVQLIATKLVAKKMTD